MFTVTVNFKLKVSHCATDSYVKTLHPKYRKVYTHKNRTKNACKKKMDFFFISTCSFSHNDDNRTCHKTSTPEAVFYFRHASLLKKS